MQKKISTIKRIISHMVRSRSFKRYLFVGFSTVAIDYTLLVVFRMVFSSGLVYSVTIAYWMSIAYNFLLNRHWSFGAGGGMVPRQVVLYSLLLIFNYLVTIGVVWGLGVFGASEYISKVFALALTISWTYVFYKKIIFTT